MPYLKKYPFSFRLILLHLSCWLLLIASEIGYLLALGSRLDPWYDYVVFYGLNLGLFYSLLALPQLKLRSRRATFSLRLLFFLLLIAGYLLFKIIATHYLLFASASWSRQLLQWRLFLLSSAVRGSYFVFLAGLYWTATHLGDYRRRLTEARLAHLQQQLNPHLLFNSLNFIYTSVYQQSAAAAEQVHLLAELMRFSYLPPDADGRILLEAELRQIENLIRLNQQRYNGALCLLVDLPLQVGEQRLIPLILLTLTENLFKHGNLQEPDCPGRLTVALSGNQLRFHSFNLKKRLADPSPSSQIGLVNLELRLALAYENRYTLSRQNTTDTFELTLLLPV